MLENILKSKWYLITINNPHMLNGDGVFDILNFITISQQFKFVILNDIEGAPKANHPGLITFFQHQEGQAIVLQDFLKNVPGVLQFDWADFFLFEKSPVKWIYDEIYPNSIRQTDITVRAVDGQYIYIYTLNHQIVEAVKNKYSIESLKFDILENLDHPY